MKVHLHHYPDIESHMELSYTGHLDSCIAPLQVERHILHITLQCCQMYQSGI